MKKELKKILITAGPTREAIDSVRFITNKSTGKMGYAIAQEALKNFEVILISGPVNLPQIKHKNCTNIFVESAEEMYNAVLNNVENCDILIMSAAVADYTPVKVYEQKMKKSAGNFSLELKRTKDILATVAPLKKKSQIFIGFAAETENLWQNAQEKLIRKKLDFIIANDVSNKSIGFSSEENAVTIISHDSKIEIPQMKKSEIAREILKVFL